MMKHTKRIFALLLAVLMIAALSVTAFADSAYKITIDNAVVGETYNAYQIFGETQGTTKTYVAVKGSDAKLDANRFVTYYSREGETYTEISDKTTIDNSDTVYEEVVSPAAYTIKTSSLWFNTLTGHSSGGYNATYTPDESDGAYGLTFTQSAGDASVYVVTYDATQFSAAAFAEKLKTYLDSLTGEELTDMDGSKKAFGKIEGTPDGKTNKSVTLDVGEAGYYFIDTSVGSLCALDTTTPNVTVHEKNTIPTVVKQVSETEGTYGDGPVNVDIGDTVYFQLTVSEGIGTDTAITVHDTMDPGLTLDPTSFAIKNGSNDVESKYYTIKVNSSAKVTATPSYGTTADTECTFEIVFNDTYIKSLGKDAQLVITYKAVLNAAAEIFENNVSEKTNDNNSHLTYSNQTTTDSTVKVKTYDFRLYKTDGKKPLAGVTFKLTKIVGDKTYYYQNSSDATDGSVVTTTGVWTDTETTHQTAADTGIIDFKGLDAGTYVLTETATLAGYNLLTDTITVTIEDDGTVTAKNTAKGDSVAVNAATLKDETITPANFTIVNNTGIELPSTGGIGTTIFYVVGGILVAGALIVLITKKRMGKEEA